MTKYVGVIKNELGLTME